MQRIREDNERIVEKILLAKPTLQNRKEHSEFFNKHREISKRLSRYSHVSPARRAKRYSSPRELQSVLLPDLPRRRTSFRHYFPVNYKYERKGNQYSLARQ